MITKRIIPCLDVKNGRVVKGATFEGLKDMADPVELARRYNAAGADELVFYDITASAEGRTLFTDILKKVAAEIFIPLTVGGGIRTLQDFDRVLKCGADKVSVNSGAIENPGLIAEAAQKYGDQCVVLSVDAKRVDGKSPAFMIIVLVGYACGIAAHLVEGTKLWLCWIYLVDMALVSTDLTLYFHYSKRRGA